MLWGKEVPLFFQPYLTTHVAINCPHSCSGSGCIGQYLKYLPFKKNIKRCLLRVMLEGKARKTIASHISQHCF